MSSDHRIQPYDSPYQPLCTGFIDPLLYSATNSALRSCYFVLSPLLFLLIQPRSLYMPRHNAFPPATSSRGIRTSARDALTSLGVDSQRLHARADRILRYTSKTHAVYCRNALRGNSRSDDIEMVTTNHPFIFYSPSRFSISVFQ